MASSELPKTGGGEGSVWTAETEEFNRDKAIEVLEEVGTFKILAEAAAAFGKEDIWGYDYESMSDDELSAFFDKVNEIRGAEDGDPKGDDDPKEDGGIADADPGSIGGGAKHENNEGTGDKVLKKKVGGKILATAGILALAGTLFWAGGKFRENQLGNSDAATATDAATGTDAAAWTDAATKIDAVAGSLGGDAESIDASQHSYDSTADEASKEADAESEHNYGERYENISEASTFHNHFANEDGTDYNKNGKSSDYAFDIGYESSDDEQNLKNQMCEALTQPGVLAVYYSETKDAVAESGYNGWGVTDLSYVDENDLEAQMMADSELHQKVYDAMYDAIQDGNVENGILEAGTYDNYYFDADFSKGDVDKTGVEIVGQTTEEDGAEVLELTVSWSSGGSGGSGGSGKIKVKKKCKQVVTKQGKTWKLRQVNPPEEKKTPPTEKKTPPTETTPGEPTPQKTPETPQKTPPTPKTPETPEDNSKDPNKINERAGDDVTYDTDGSAKDKTTNPVNEWQKKPTEDGEGGGKPANSEGQDGNIQNNIDNADKTDNDAQNVSNPDERASEEQKEKDAQEKEKTAKENNAENENKSNEERKNDTDTNNDGVVDYNEAMQ